MWQTKHENVLNLYDVRQEAQLLLGKADRTAYARSPASDFSHGEKVICQRWHSFMHTELTLSQKLQWKPV